MTLTNILTNAITSSQTEILMVNPNIFPSGPGVVTIGSEQIHFAAATSNSLLACTRGYNSTTPASALKGATVTLTSSDEPGQVGTLIGTAPITVTNGSQVLRLNDATLSMHVADATHDGYTAQADFGRTATFLGALAADPGSPTEGQMWYNTTTHLLKYQDNSGTKVVATV